MNIVLISTYELGRQPFGLASPAAWLRESHSVTVMDLARQSLDENAVRNASLIAIYLPMHTATRLATELIPTLHRLNPGAHLCCYGLYAPMNADYLRSLGVTTILGGEFESALAHLAARLSEPAQGNGPQVDPPLVSLERLAFRVPDRAGLPELKTYAHLNIPGQPFRIAGSTEASRGCLHLCRHCPVVPVYQGQFRIVSQQVVLEDIRRQVAAGAQHISFGDPDFFNGPRHALELVQALHAEFPAVTYDATIKIEHLRKYQRHLETLRATGCLFVISAVESVDDATLAALDKGHTRADFLYVAAEFRDIGLTLHPTFLPFSPWTTLEGYIDLLKVIQGERLIENVAPIQLGIRLLIPEGSRILELDSVRALLSPFDQRQLFYPWQNADPRVDLLAQQVQQIAAHAEKLKKSRVDTFGEIWRAAHSAAGLDTPALANFSEPATPVPFLSEPWYCCAEPTAEQFVAIGSPKSTPPPQSISPVSAETFL